MFHLDNASSSYDKINNRITWTKTQQSDRTSTLFPDLVICDFWLVFNLKENLGGHHFHSKNEIDETVKNIFLRF